MAQDSLAKAMLRPTLVEVNGVTCVMRLARCSPNTIPLFPKLPATFPSPLQLGRGLMKLWPKKCKWKLMYTTSRGDLSKAILQDPAHSLSLPYSYVSVGSITDKRGMGIAM